jgi:Domain of unknown function (DUF4336)
MLTPHVPSLYDPINVYKPVAADIGIVNGPFEYLTMIGVRLPLPFATRMTVVNLRNGALFLHSPIAFDAALATQLQSMGTIRHLISPNQFHYAHTGEWSRAFPDAITWASPGVLRRARLGGSTCSSRETLGRTHHRNGATKSIRPLSPAASLGKSSSCKRQEILIEAVPGLRRMAPLADANKTTGVKLDVLQEAARARNIELSIYRVTKGEETAAAIGVAKTSGAAALNVLASPMLDANHHPVIDRVAALRLPAMYQWPELAEEGGFAAYGPRCIELSPPPTSRTLGWARTSSAAYCEIRSTCNPNARYSTVRFWPSIKPRRPSSSKKAMFAGLSRESGSKQPRR